MGTGLYLWRSGDYDYARTLRFHPPLAHHLASLPLLALDLDDLEIGPDLGGRLIHGSDPPPQRVRRLSRAPFLLLACWGGVLVFAWAREIAGAAAGLLAAFLYTFSPQILGHGFLAHSDISVTVLYLQTLYAFWRWCQRRTGVRFALCGVSLGLALLAKLSALLLLPSLALILLALALTRRPDADPTQRPSAQAPGPAAHLAGAAASYLGFLAIAVAVLWLGYGGSFAVSTGASGPFAGWRLPAYLHSLGFDIGANAMGRPVFFFGEIWPRGRWFVLPVAFALKTPLAVLALFGAALLVRTQRAQRLALFLGVPALVYAAVACFWLKVPLGLRYLLPLYPLLHVFVAARLAPARSPAGRGLLLAGCAWLAWSSLAIHPHYLAYFNELRGGPPAAYHQLIDSNLDLGQDLGTLAEFFRERGNPPLRLAYFGVESPERYGLRAAPLRGCGPVRGWVAISANHLQGLYSPRSLFQRAPPGCFDWLLEREPLAQPGYSILVYEIPDELR